MKNRNKKDFYIALSSLISFALWTISLCFIDKRAIGPKGSIVGFSTINGIFHNFIGVNIALYNLTDWLGLVPIAFALGFAFLGLVQWIKRKHILKVDYSILILGVFYIITVAAFVIFEIFPVNYRPVLINGCLEASYPSSTTLIVTCVMPASLMQFNARIKNRILKLAINFFIDFFICFMVMARLISGVHWITDIIGGLLLSLGLVAAYSFFVKTEPRLD